MPVKHPHNPQKITGQVMLNLRTKLALNQSDFWTVLGVTQSAGSRYETGREMPGPTRIAAAHYYAPEIGRHKRSIFTA